MRLSVIQSAELNGRPRDGGRDLSPWDLPTKKARQQTKRGNSKMKWLSSFGIFPRSASRTKDFQFWRCEKMASQVLC